jgi:hypothetical protein
MLIWYAFTRIHNFEFRNAAGNKLKGWAGFELLFCSKKGGNIT